MDKITNAVAGQTVDFGGFTWKVVKMEGAVAFCSKVVDGKVQRGRPHKFLVETSTTDLVPDVEQSTSELTELLF